MDFNSVVFEITKLIKNNQYLRAIVEMTPALRQKPLSHSVLNESFSMQTEVLSKRSRVRVLEDFVFRDGDKFPIF